MYNANDCSFMYNATPQTCMLNDIEHHNLFATWRKRIKIYLNFQPEPCFGSMQQTVISRKEV